MINIALIGAGQLGSRHLQALALLKQNIAIQVIDSSPESLNTAEARFKEVSTNFIGSVTFHIDTSALEKNIDIAIIATNSKARRSVIEQLVQKSVVKNLILEKFLFINEEDYSKIESLLSEKNIKTWVNCPRRMMSFYQNLKSELKGNINFSATGNNWGLGCNGIHFLDLFAFLTNTTNIVLNNNLIDEKVIESKRDGYIEFTGTIKGEANNHSFQITSFAENSSPLQITINTPTIKFSIEEGTNAKVWISKLENKWAWEEKSFSMPFQSQLTNILVDEILDTGNCSLTTYKESSQLHILFLNNLLAHLRKINNDNSIVECPIT